MHVDYEAREAMQALRSKLSKRATSSEFNEWDAREVCEYIDALRSQLEEAKRTLQGIADQPLFEEMTEEEQDDACFSDGYDECVRRARSFLKENGNG